MLQADPATGALTKFTISEINNFQDPIATLRGIGSSLCAIPIGFNITSGLTSFTMPAGTQIFVATYLPVACAITSLAFVQKQSGVYTASNNNKVGIYSVSGNTLTLIASSANNGNLWKSTANTLHIEPLTGTINLQPGAYFVSYLYNESAQTTSPQFMGTSWSYVSTALFFDVTTFLFPIMSLAGQTDLAGSTSFAAASAVTSNAALFMYGTPL